MKVVHEISPEQYVALRESVLRDEMSGIDPGAYWAKLYPDATEVEFKVVWNGADERTANE